MSIFSRIRDVLSPPPGPSRAVFQLDGDAGKVLDALRSVVDPELGRDVVSLGMVRAVSVEAGRAVVDLCPTTAGCPLTGWLTTACTGAAEEAGFPAEVRVVTEPPWSPSDMEGGG